MANTKTQTATVTLLKVLTGDETPKTFMTIWRNKWLTSDATSIDDMVNSLKVAIKKLKQLKHADIEADFQSACDDYIFFRTENVKLAEVLEFEEEDQEQDEN